MKLGPIEIILVVLVIVIIAIATRMRSPNSRQAAETNRKQIIITKAQADATNQKQPTVTEANDEEILRSRFSRGKIFGIVMIIIGALLIVAAPNLIKAFFMSYLWGGLIIIAGIASLYFMSRRS